MAACPPTVAVTIISHTTLVDATVIQATVATRHHCRYHRWLHAQQLWLYQSLAYTMSVDTTVNQATRRATIVHTIDGCMPKNCGGINH
jgi:hypothetical protein